MGIERIERVVNLPPRIAVCMAAYNGAAYIDEQINSILEQQGVDLMLFVSVDMSTDHTEALVHARALTDKRIVLLPGGKRFGAAAPNFYRLLREVSLEPFDALAWADQDDIWHLDKLARAWRLMQSMGAAGYSSNVTAFWESGRRVLVDKARPQRRHDHLFEAAGPGCTYVMGRELALGLRDLARHDEVALSDIGYHDWAAYAYARTRGMVWHIDPEPCLLYRQHANNQLGANTGWRSLARRARNVLSGKALRQACLVARAVGAWDDAFVRRGLRGGRAGLFWLALQAPQCRRRPLERLYFAALCLLMCTRPTTLWRIE